jgi:hypothetical protein
MRISDAIKLAESIATQPSESIPQSIHMMTRSRKLSEAITALNELALDHPRYKPVAIAALENLGMWISPERFSTSNGAITLGECSLPHLEESIERILGLVWADIVEMDPRLISARPNWVKARARNLIRADLVARMPEADP